MKRIELYTCSDGLQLLNRGSKFGAWKTDSQSFTEAEDNIKISVDGKDIVPNELGDYDIINIKSVKIVD